MTKSDNNVLLEFHIGVNRLACAITKGISEYQETTTDLMKRRG